MSVTTPCPRIRPIRPANVARYSWSDSSARLPIDPGPICVRSCRRRLTNSLIDGRLDRRTGRRVWWGISGHFQPVHGAVSDPEQDLGDLEVDDQAGPVDERGDQGGGDDRRVDPEAT